MKQLFVCGFLMDFTMDRFITIDKGSTLAAAGTIGLALRSCGVGGKIKLKDSPENDVNITFPLGESPHEAMEREFLEETGHFVAKKRWHCFLIKEYKEVKLYVFAAFGSPSELAEVVAKSRDLPKSEGIVSQNYLIDIFFDPMYFTFDTPFFLQLIKIEMNAGSFLKLDPEGTNTSGKN